MVACICHSPLHHQKPDFEGQSVIKASSYLLPFVLEAHRESLPRSCETSARRLSAESAEVYSTADLPASAAHIPFSRWYSDASEYLPQKGAVNGAVSLLEIYETHEERHSLPSVQLHAACEPQTSCPWSSDPVETRTDLSVTVSSPHSKRRIFWQSL